MSKQRVQLSPFFPPYLQSNGGFAKNEINRLKFYAINSIAVLLDVAFTVQMIFRSFLPSGSQNPLDFISIEENVVFARKKINDCLKIELSFLFFLKFL